MVVQGRVGSISACLPWFNWSGETILKLQGLNLTLKPVSEKRTRQGKYRADQNIDTWGLYPMMNSRFPFFLVYDSEDEGSPVMSSSLHFADDFLKTEMEPDQDQELYKSIQQLQDPEEVDMDYGGTGGLQVLTSVIDKMLAKVKVDVIDTVIHVIHPSAVTLAGDLYHRTGGGGGDNSGNKEYSLDIEIPKISYFDETPSFSDNITNPTAVPTANMVESSILVPPSSDEIIKIITISSPKVWLRSCNIPSLYSQPTTSETTLDMNDSTDDTTDLSQTEFFEASEGDSNLFRRDSLHSSFMTGSITPKAYSSLHIQDRTYEALLFTTMEKDNWIRLKTRPASSLFPQPAQPNQSYPSAQSPAQSDTKNIDVYFSHIRTVVTPKQVAFILDILTATNAPDSSTSTTTSPSPLSPRNRRPSSNLEQVIRDQRRPSTTDLSPPRSSGLDPYGSQTRRKPSSSKKASHEVSPSPAPEIKIKLQIPLMEHFFFYDELPPSSPSSAIDPPISETSHLKIWIHQLIIRLQQYPPHNRANAKTDGIRRVPLPRIDTAATSSSSQLPPLAFVLDSRIQNMGFVEWVTPPPNLMDTPSTPPASVRMKYNCYLPILEFTDSICSDYDDSVKFPAYSHQLSTSHVSFDHSNSQGKTKKDVIRIRLEKRSAVKLDQFKESKSRNNMRVLLC